MAKVAGNAKRFAYVSNSEQDITTEESDNDYSDYYADNRRGKRNSDDSARTQDSDGKTKRRPRCLNRNALMARENRLRKKMYIESLEKNVRALKTNNKKLSTIADEQSFLIKNLQRQIKYLKSVLANSSDICSLMKTVHSGTGMSVNTSLEKNLTPNNDCVSKTKLHPWEDSQFNNLSVETNALLKDCFYYKSDYTDEAADLFPEIEDTLAAPASAEALSEHSYTTRAFSDKTSDEEDVGVCLHVSKHRVSLEFCPTCSENAQQAWKD